MASQTDKHPIVPKSYLCFKCKTIGKHWIINCNDQQHAPIHHIDNDDDESSSCSSSNSSAAPHIILPTIKELHALIHDHNTYDIMPDKMQRMKLDTMKSMETLPALQKKLEMKLSSYYKFVAQTNTYVLNQVLQLQHQYEQLITHLDRLDNYQHFDNEHKHDNHVTFEENDEDGTLNIISPTGQLCDFLY